MPRREAVVAFGGGVAESGATSTDPADVSGGFDEHGDWRKTWCDSAEGDQLVESLCHRGNRRSGVDLPGPVDRPWWMSSRWWPPHLLTAGRPPAHLGVSQWSSRLLDQHLSISFTTVRTWRKWGPPARRRNVHLRRRPQVTATGSRPRRTLPKHIAARCHVASTSLGQRR